MARAASTSKRAVTSGSRGDVACPTRADVQTVLDELKRVSSKKVLDEMGPRYGIHTKKAMGVMMRDMQAIAKNIGKDTAFAQMLWDTGWYEARMVACMIDEPEKVTPARMEAWCKDFDNWGIVDTVCFKLWDQVPHAINKVHLWAKRKEEFQKRAAFALLACIALHNGDVDDKELIACLPLIEQAASDERNFVKKGVSWALRSMGLCGPRVRTEVIKLSKKLAASTDKTERWLGKEALKAVDPSASKKK